MLQELFEFGDLTAGEVMVPRVRITGIPVGSTPERDPRAARRHRRTRAIRSSKSDLDHIVGMIHIKDLLRLLLRRRDDRPGARAAAAARARDRAARRRARDDAAGADADGGRDRRARRHRRRSSRSRICSRKSSARSTRARRRPAVRIAIAQGRLRVPGHDARRRARAASSTSSWSTRRWTASAAWC